MKYFLTFFTLFFISCSIFFFSGFNNSDLNSISNNDDAIGGEYKIQKSVCITEEQRKEIQKQINNSLARLKAEGKLPRADPRSTVTFAWPLQGAGLNDDYGYYGISNFIDHNSSYPNQLLDYNCGMRTYDTPAGYNHQGTDIFLWPFSWYKMDNNQVQIVAAAPGTIIYKSDGNFDRNCAFNNGNWNAVYIQHSDGSIAWYGHMKMNSLTPKNIGQTVVLGEYLGCVGSSGSSTGPHLHFEIYNSSNQLQDPWQGACNNFNSNSLWTVQKPYYDPNVNKLMTHSAPPVFPNCPQQEILNEKNNFQPGDQVITAAYYRDQQQGQQSQLFLIQPDNSVNQSWNHTSPQYYSASYWYWTRTIPGNAQTGTWKFRVLFNSQIYEHSFTVGINGIQPVSSEIPVKFSLYQNYPNPFNPSTEIKFDIPPHSQNTITTLTIYDIMGRVAEVLVNEEVKPGRYRVNWDASKISSGIYFCRIISGNFTDSKKMLMVK
jgi:murein DD-endopeptidase MepM/ murein hydrolase activator NlpD